MSVSQSDATEEEAQLELPEVIEEVVETDEEELREYLGDSIIPLLSYGLEELEKTRPPDPVGFLAHFLLRHNPKKSVQIPCK